MIKSKKRPLKVTVMLYILMSAYGISTVLIGTQLLILVQEFDLSLAEGGIFTVVINIGCMLGIVISGFFLHKYQKRFLVMGSYFIFSITLILVGILHSYTGFLILLLFIGISMKFLDAAINALVSQINPTNTGFCINLLHCSFAVGSFVGPIFATVLLEQGYGWRSAYVLLGVICLILLGVFGRIQAVAREGEKIESSPDQVVSFVRLMEPKVICLMLVLLCYCGHQIGINSWLPAYMQEILGAGEAVANFSLSAFWIGLIISRLVSAILTRKVKTVVILLGGNLMGALLLAIGLGSGKLLFTILGVMAAGLFAGAAIPLTITIGYSWFPQVQGKMSTIMFMCIAGGAVIFPWLMGLVSESWGLLLGMAVDTVCLCGAVIFSFAIFLKESKREGISCG